MSGGGVEPAAVAAARQRLGGGFGAQRIRGRWGAMYIYIYTYIHIRTYIYIYIYIYMYIMRVYRYICMCA